MAEDAAESATQRAGQLTGEIAALQEALLAARGEREARRVPPHVHRFDWGFAFLSLSCIPAQFSQALRADLHKVLSERSALADVKQLLVGDED